MGCRQDVSERDRERGRERDEEEEETRSLIRNGVFSGNGTSIDRDRIAVAGRRVNATTTSIIGIAEISTSGCFEGNDYTNGAVRCLERLVRLLVISPRNFTLSLFSLYFS